MQLKIENFVSLFDLWSDIMDKNREHLIQLDEISGDGDLGLSMSDGFRAIAAFAHETDFTDLGLFFYHAGKTMNEHASSTLGTLISSGFMEVGKVFKGRSEISGSELALLLHAFQDGITSRGKAKAGDKTFLDGLIPAVLVMDGNQGEDSVGLSLLEAAQAAQNGSASTVGMLARWGRAARYGEDSRQILDPGSVVAALMVSGLSQSINQTFFT